VVFCAPAAALLMASGLMWLAGLVRLAPAGRRHPALTAVPAVALAAVIAVVLVVPQQRARTTGARIDDLRRVAAIVASGERPGDAVLYLPWDTRVAGLAYPGPFLRLRDVGLLASPVASATLTGIPVSPAQLARRFRGVARVWVIRWRQPAPPATPLVREQLALLGGMRLVSSWTVQSVILRLYEAGPPPTSR
jgi:mannosyltransferase